MPAFQQELYLQALFLSQTYCRLPLQTVLSLNPYAQSVHTKDFGRARCIFSIPPITFPKVNFSLQDNTNQKWDSSFSYLFIYFISGKSFHPVLDIKEAQSFLTMFKPRKRGNGILMNSAYQRSFPNQSYTFRGQQCSKTTLGLWNIC